MIEQLENEIGATTHDVACDVHGNREAFLEQPQTVLGSQEGEQACVFGRSARDLVIGEPVFRGELDLRPEQDILHLRDRCREDGTQRVVGMRQELMVSQLAEEASQILVR